ncbi:MAG: HAMP domain-containing histidine kinase [Pedobacter sp.]|nr:MAG: HAMP domain-containing histidine kinase [Pedobacter sp.]
MGTKLGSTLFFLISFLVLIALQSYYLNNSYQLEKRELNKKLQETVTKVLTELEKVESDASEDSVILSLKKLSKNQRFMVQKVAQKKQWYAYKNYFEAKVDSILGKQTVGTGFRIAMRSEIYSVYDEIRHRELLTKNAPLILFKTSVAINKGLVFNEGKWNSNFSERDTEFKIDQKYHYVIRSRVLAELLNIRGLVFMKLLPLLIVSMLIVSLLSFLFWRTSKNLKLQQLKVAQLYTSIDSIAHELNTPLTTMKFTLAAMPRSEITNLFERQILRLERVVSSIHYTAGKSALLNQKDLDDYFIELRQRYGHISFHIKMLYERNRKTTTQDFQQLLDNLVENSVKYKSKKVNIGVEFSNKIVISVSDNGMGIPKDAQPYIFDKYYRISRPENLQINGLGVGLHIVKMIVEKYKGTIAVATNSVAGVTFKISLPNG